MSTHPRRRLGMLRIMFPPADDNGFVSVATLLDWMPQLGLPHFQRGQVWRHDSVSRLLESLMWDTPCGSIILWVPTGSVADFGVPAEWGTTSTDYLVVDGQQRLTALSSVLTSREDSTHKGQVEDWSLNLAAIPEFLPCADIAPTKRLRARPLFIPTPLPPPGEASEQRRGAFNAAVRDLVSVTRIEDQGVAAWPYEKAAPADSAVHDLWSRVASGVQAIRRRHLQVVIKRGTPLPEIVQLYNRINSSGVAVRAEERAFAAMVAYEPKASKWLRECFDSAHPDSPGEPGQRPDRNTLLKRERERQFGFPLFLRAYAQSAAHHLDQDGSDLELLATLGWNDEWMAAESGRRRVLDRSRDCIAATAAVLRSEIGCDDYRFLPSAEPLRPLFTLFLKYPELDPHLAAKAVVLLQVDAILQGRDGQRALAQRIRRSNSLGEAMAALPPLASASDVKSSLTRAQSMQDPWVSLLYWYERSHQATDYGLNFQPLTIKAKAHREHIVPFSLLHPAYPDLDATGHSKTHEASALGNLTLISDEFNFDHGADPVALHAVPVGFLRAHHLDDPAIQASYRAACDQLSTGNLEAGKEHYRQFVQQRTDSLAAGMYEWLSRLTATQPLDPQTRPARQLIHPSAADDIRERHWPLEFQDAVLELTRKVYSPTGNKWILWRCGTGKQRSQVANQVRLFTAGNLIAIGRHVDEGDAIADALSSLLDSAYVDRSQWGFTLNPADPAAVAAVQLLTRNRP